MKFYEKIMNLEKVSLIFDMVIRMYKKNLTEYSFKDLLIFHKKSGGKDLSS
jgi:hypothetical protein